VQSDESQDRGRDVENDKLVPQDRCRAHDVLAVDQLVTQEILRELEEVLVGHLSLRGADGHLTFPFAAMLTPHLI
jgi:hypothetical protein